jgi:hypothetical protein
LSLVGASRWTIAVDVTDLAEAPRGAAIWPR